MTDCCCQRAAHTHTHKQFQLRKTLARIVKLRMIYHNMQVAFSHILPLSISQRQPLGHFHTSFSHDRVRQLEQQLDSCISSHRPVCKPVDPSHNDPCKGQPRAQNKGQRWKNMLFFSLISFCVDVSHGIGFLTSEGWKTRAFAGRFVNDSWIEVAEWLWLVKNGAKHGLIWVFVCVRSQLSLREVHTDVM